MPCEHYKDALIEAAASGATPRGDLRAHLNACASCRTAFVEEQSLFAAIDSGLHDAANAEVPPSLLPRVRTRLAVAAESRFRWVHSLVFAPVAVALAFAVFLLARPHRGASPDPVAKQGPVNPGAMTPATSKNPAKIFHEDRPTATVHAAHVHAARNSTIPHSMASGNPEVLVPPDEREGLAQLVATLNDHRDVAVAFLAQHPEKKDALVTVDPLKISDIEIKPLEGTETETSDGTGEKH